MGGPLKLGKQSECETELFDLQYLYNAALSLFRSDNVNKRCAWKPNNYSHVCLNKKTCLKKNDTFGVDLGICFYLECSETLKTPHALHCTLQNTFWISKLELLMSRIHQK